MLALAWHGVDTVLSKSKRSGIMITANLQHDLVPRCELLTNVHNTTGSHCYAMNGTLLLAGTALLLMLLLTGID